MQIFLEMSKKCIIFVVEKEIKNIKTMTKEEIRNAAMKAAKDYGYDWVMAEFDYEDGNELLKGFKKEMKNKGHSQVCIFDGEEPYFVMDMADLVDEMEEGEVFTEGEVYHWITLGRIDAWKELLGRKNKKVGYFCDGYGGYVFLPEMECVTHLKQRGEVVMA